LRRGAKEASDYPQDFDIRVVQERTVPVKPLNAGRPKQRRAGNTGVAPTYRERGGGCQMKNPRRMSRVSVSKKVAVRATCMDLILLSQHY
jgi:hypothetical protein